MTQLEHSMFQRVFFPAEDENRSQQSLMLQKVLRFQVPSDITVAKAKLVVFDFETTGLDSTKDRIIEIGALAVEDGKAVGEFSTLIKPDILLPETAAKITGITEAMLADKPSIEDKWGEFLAFIEGSILVAHNAEFDMAFLRRASARLGYQVHWPCFCTLKLARQLLPDLESKNLDSLAQHYGLTFEARHRSIGDCKVTSAVLQSFLTNEGKSLKSWEDFSPYAVNDQ
ncbi:MAG: 3'-5' exonuclease [Pseudobacteriovorax sp.]|nr:3'-5' exonuclease [Pseudobacteriovorax sp.]